ncbi:DUF937 domain-containing protein [Tenacibaculum sp. C7A-26P2]|uniref:DUF937 domain-containing protein n=1 Tax=Tenacibaculum sp. C7A-26P2 TaxID=3447504 RepID=UPI003F84BEF8
MAGILELLNSDLGKNIISGVAGSTGEDSSKTSNVLSMALPVLMKAMQRNSSSKEGAESLMNALTQKHDGSVLDNLGNLLKNGVNNDIMQDGSKILGHILGNKQGGIEQVISQKTGVTNDSVTNILKTATPLLMGLLGKQTKENGLSNSNDLSGFLGNLLGGESTKKEQNFLEQILDADGDGSVIDDVAGMVLGGSNKSSGGIIGNVLGGLFGKK